MTVYNSTEDVEIVEAEVVNEDKKNKEGASICTLNDLLFKVDLIDNPKKTNSEYRRIVVGIINGEEMDLNYCSPRYELVKNEAIFPQVEEILRANNIEFEAEYTHINNVRFYADIRITDRRYIYKMNGTNDVIYPLLRVQHSYNGLTKYKIVFGYFRMVCTNGLTIAVEEMKHFNLVITGKHTTSILRSLEQLNNMLHMFAENAAEVTTVITAKYETLRSRNVLAVEARIEEVLKAAKIAAIDNSKFNTVNYIKGIVLDEANGTNGVMDMGYNGQVNDWLIYNAVNRYIYDNSRNIAAPEKRMEVDSLVFEYMLKHE
jgi:hypothetical protein